MIKLISHITDSNKKKRGRKIQDFTVKAKKVCENSQVCSGWGTMMSLCHKLLGPRHRKNIIEVVEQLLVEVYLLICKFKEDNRLI